MRHCLLDTHRFSRSPRLLESWLTQLVARGSQIITVSERTARIEYGAEGFQQSLRCPKETSRPCSVSGRLDYSCKGRQTEGNIGFIVKLLTKY